MTYKSMFIASIAILIGITSSCSGPKSATTSITTGPAISYNVAAKAIIDANCASSCHNATRPAGGIDLTIYQNVKDQCINGKLLDAIQHKGIVLAMPKNKPKLSDADIQAVKDWVASGASE